MVDDLVDAAPGTDDEAPWSKTSAACERPRPGQAELELRARVIELEAELAGVRKLLGRARSLVDSALDYAIVTLDLDGLITGWNAGAQKIMGYRDAEILGRTADILFTSEDRRSGRLATELTRALEIGRAANERWHLRRDGTRFWASGLMMPLLGADGRPEGFLNILRDRTEEQAGTERRELLMTEMNHRIKNTFSVVQAVASRTLWHAPTVEAFQPAFAGRLAALARSQDVLIRGNWDEAPLIEVIEGALEGFAVAGRIVLKGPSVKLAVESVVTVSLAFHELATNALKHGALSVPEGRVEITWTTGASAGDAEKVDVVWSEIDGPAVSPPSRRGFGSQLLEQGMPRHGTVDLEFRPQGLRCRICLPLGQGG